MKLTRTEADGFAHARKAAQARGMTLAEYGAAIAQAARDELADAEGYASAHGGSLKGFQPVSRLQLGPVLP